MTAQATAALDTPYQLGSAQIASFAEHGFVRLPGVATEELLEACQPEITRTVLAHSAGEAPLAERDTYGKAFLQVCNLWRHSETVRELVMARRFARIAADLLGVAGVRLYHDQALYKEAGGGHTPWHADQYYWPLSSDRCCTMWLPLQPTPLAMGPLAFAAGSHRLHVGRDLPISDTSEDALRHALAERHAAVIEEPYALGDASFHLGWTFHHAAANTTRTPRRVMTVIYIDADILISEPTNQHQKADLAAWFPGGRPGQVPHTPLNPVLHHA